MSQMDVEGEATPERIENRQYSIPIFQSIHVWQQQNGMRQNDYEHYRRFCTVKLQRIRKRIGFLNKKGKLYEKMPFEVKDVKDAESLFYPLLNSERCWAYANELKEELNETRNTRIRFHLIGRIKKAAQWSKQLMDLCHQLCDDRTALESDAYMDYMEGNKDLEMSNWKSALEHYLRTKLILESLSQIGSSSSRDLYLSRLSELQPIIRYCEYHIKRSEGRNADQLLSMMNSSDAIPDTLNQKLTELLHNDHLQNSEEMRVVEFRGTFIRIENEDIRVLLLECRDAESLLQSVKQAEEEKIMSVFSTLFEKYDQIIRVLSNTKDKVMKSGNTSRLNDISLLFTLYKFYKERRIVERNVLLLNSLMKEYQTKQQVNLNNLIALASNVIEGFETLNELNNELPEGVDDQSKQENSHLTETIDYLHLKYRAIRAYYAGESYLLNKKYDYAMTMSLFASQIVAELTSMETTPCLFVKKEEEFVDFGTVNDISQETELLNCRIKAEAYLNQSKKEEGKSTGIDTTLSTPIPYKSNGKYEVISIPVPMHIASCKPLFFDLYADCVNYPSMEARIKTEEKKEEKKGWFSGWWYDCLL